MKRSSLDLPRAVKKGCALEVCVCMCVCKFVVLGKNFFGLCDLNLGQGMRNLACGDG